jgi:hypothetical protein
MEMVCGDSTRRQGLKARGKENKMNLVKIKKK